MILCLGQYDTCSVIRETIIIGMDWNRAMIFKYVSGYRLLISGTRCKTLGNDGKTLSVRASIFYTKQLRCIPKIVSVFAVPSCTTVNLFFWRTGLVRSMSEVY